MSNQPEDKKSEKDPDQEAKKGNGPDPETLHKTDPQDNMKGPISSFMHSVKDEVEKGNAESKEEADKKKDENT